MKTNLNLPLKLLLLLLLGLRAVLAQSPDARLLTTFTNPAPAEVSSFSYSVAGFGDDRVLVGLAGGAAYLLSTSGTLLTTFTIDDPDALAFGGSLAGVGSDRVLIGAR